MKILILCDDKWHPAEVVERGLAFLAEEGHALDFVRDAKDILTPAFLGRYPVVINAKGNALTGANDAPWFEEGVTEAGPEELCALLERSGLPLYATALRADTVSLEQAGLGRCAVIIGSEGRGVSQSLLDRSGQTIRIPMRSRCESLNAAAAASVVLWEMVRQGGLEE